MKNENIFQADIENSSKSNYAGDPMDWQFKLNKGYNRIVSSTNEGHESIENKDSNHSPTLSDSVSLSFIFSNEAEIESKLL